MFDYEELRKEGDDAEQGLLTDLPSTVSRFRSLRLEWNQSTSRYLSLILFAVLIPVFFLLGIGFQRFVLFDEQRCLDTPWDEMRNAVKFKTLEFNPHFTGPKSEYQGPPNPSLDKLWYDLAAIRNFGVEKHVLDSINRSHAAVQYPQDGTYQVSLQVDHQLHCLNYIRMYTYMDHYEKIDYDMVAETLEDRQTHKDHCVESLRQRLLCNPDLNIYTHHWLNRPGEWVNLFTSHRCVDWDHFHKWEIDNQARFKIPTVRPPDAEVW